MQHVREPLGGAQRLEDDEQRQADRDGEQGLVLRVLPSWLATIGSGTCTASGSSRVEAGSDASDPDAELYEMGGLLPSPDAKLAGPTYQEWLEATIPAGSQR